MHRYNLSGLCGNESEMDGPTCYNRVIRTVVICVDFNRVNESYESDINHSFGVPVKSRRKEPMEGTRGNPFIGTTSSQ